MFTGPFSSYPHQCWVTLVFLVFTLLTWVTSSQINFSLYFFVIVKILDNVLKYLLLICFLSLKAFIIFFICIDIFLKVCTSCACLVPMRSRTLWKVTWKWIYRWLWAAIWMMETESESSVKSVIAFKCWDIPLEITFFFLLRIVYSVL